MKPRSIVLLWLLAVFSLLLGAKALGFDGELFAGIMGIVGLVVGYYFGRGETGTT